MNIYQFLIYIEYFYYFHKLLFTLLLYKFHKILFNKPSTKINNNYT